MSDAALSEDVQAPRELEVAYHGGKRALFKLAFKTLFLSLITLGIYRFWMKARLRRYYWNATRIDGEPLEYAGTGLEKIIGFLIAVTFLAVYLGIAQVVLSFFGLAVLEGRAGVINLAFLAVVPIYFYAMFRARAYVLARTRWRGIRFALKGGAWGYAVRALWHSFVSVLSLGLLYPRQVFKLEQYLTDRTRFGDLRLRQEGRWFMLLGPWIWVWLPLVGLAGGIGYFVWQHEGRSAEEMVFSGDIAPTTYLWIFGGLAFGSLLVFALLAGFRAIATRRMALHKRAGKDVRLISAIRSGKVIRIWFLGVLGVVIASFLPLLVIGGLLALTLLVPTSDPEVSLFELLFAPTQISQAQVLGGLLISALSYMIYMFTMSVFWHLFVTQPLWRHFATTLTVVGDQEVSGARQRSRDELMQAEGFADALDLGAAI